MSSSRKNFLPPFAVAGLLALAGCGFTPLYGNNAAQVPVAAQLEQVKIGNIPERQGQMLQLSLQDQMQRDGAPTLESYVLNVSYTVASQGIGIQADTSVTRNRYIATADWVLAPIGAPDQKLASGQATSEDAANVIDQQYFALTLEGDTVNRQLADEIAAQITAQVAVYFKTHPSQG